MAYNKRRRVSSGRAVRTAMRVGNWASLARASRAARGRSRPLRGRLSLAYMNQRVKSLTRMIETKSGVWNTGTVMRDLAHNNIFIVTSPGNGLPGERLNMFQIDQGIRDGMGSGQVTNRIGDKITVKGVMIKAIFENALSRPKVFYHMMVVKCARGDVPTRATLFQGNSPVKMIDQVNTERYTVIASKKWTISASNATASIANAIDGIPEDLDVAGLVNAGMGTKAINMYISGKRFFKNGICTYENQGVAPKFFDFYIICMAYDWYGTPQDVNTVGKINTLYTKCYFQDA